MFRMPQQVIDALYLAACPTLVFTGDNGFECRAPVGRFSCCVWTFRNCFVEKNVIRCPVMIQAEYGTDVGTADSGAAGGQKFCSVHFLHSVW